MLYRQRGIEQAFIATDSLAPMMPTGMDANTFEDIDRQVCKQLDTLSPYSDIPIIKMEPENEHPDTGELEPLYYMGISINRYALFQMTDDAKPVLVKVSESGLGMLLPPYEDDNSPNKNIPEPIEGLDCPRWIYDLWYMFICDILEGRPETYMYDRPGFDKPAMYSVQITTPNLLYQFRRIDGVRPFNTYSIVLTGDTSLSDLDFTDATFFEEYSKDRLLYYTASRDSNNLGSIYDTSRHNPVGEEFEPNTIKETIGGYFEHSECTSENGNNSGLIRYRSITIDGIVYVGKESNELTDETAEATNGLLNGTYQLILDDSVASKALTDMSTKELVYVSGYSELYIQQCKRGTRQPSKNFLATLNRGLSRITHEKKRKDEAKHIILSIKSEYHLTNMQIAEHTNIGRRTITAILSGERSGNTSLEKLQDLYQELASIEPVEEKTA